MAVTASAFKTRFPEFQDVADATIDSVIAEADARLSAATWEDSKDVGAMYLTAHLLAVSPAGRNARMVNKDGSTTYGLEFEKLRAAVCSGNRVIKSDGLQPLDPLSWP